MDPLAQALRGANTPPPRAEPLRALESALVVGAGGTLGSAVLAAALVSGRFQQVGALVRGPLVTSLRGLRPVPVEPLLAGDPGDLGDMACTLAFIVFERERHSNGRDDAFFQPEPDSLRTLAAALRRCGVRRLLVVVPHAPALLPHALKQGFASADESAVAALGFEHLVFVRAAQAAGAATAGGRLQRFADWWLSQLSWMVPQREQPVRALRLAELAVHLARVLAAATPGTRVLPPELLWQASQAVDPEPLLQAWLDGVSAAEVR